MGRWDSGEPRFWPAVSIRRNRWVSRKVQAHAARTNLGLVKLLRSLHALLLILLAAVLTYGSLTEALANGKVHSQTSHRGTSWHAERDFGHGWGWDPSVGYYEGPIWGRKAKGYFRCLHLGYGWHPCPFDGVLAAQPRRWGGLWHRRS
jgi:hypothetical protein